MQSRQWTGLEVLETEPLGDLAGDGDLDAEMLERVIRETADRGCLESEQVDKLMRLLVFRHIQAAHQLFHELFELHWQIEGGREVANREFGAYVRAASGELTEQAAAGGEEADNAEEDEFEDEADSDDVDAEGLLEEGDEDTSSASPDLTWPWPIAEPKSGGSGSSPIFANEVSGLRLCGYRVGRSQGLPATERKKLLDYFFKQPLPPVVRQVHGDAYAAPGSEERLQKMANVIAALCRLKKLHAPDRYADAIADWEADLEYLRRSYYRAGSFPWPAVD